MESARGLYSRLAGVGDHHDVDEGMDSLLSLPQVNPNQPREWLHIDPQGRTRYALVTHRQLIHYFGSSIGILLHAGQHVHTYLSLTSKNMRSTTILYRSGLNLLLRIGGREVLSAG